MVRGGGASGAHVDAIFATLYGTKRRDCEVSTAKCAACGHVPSQHINLDSAGQAAGGNLTTPSVFVSASTKSLSSSSASSLSGSSVAVGRWLNQWHLLQPMCVCFLVVSKNHFLIQTQEKSPASVLITCFQTVCVTSCIRA